MSRRDSTKKLNGKPVKDDTIERLKIELGLEQPKKKTKKKYNRKGKGDINGKKSK